MALRVVAVVNRQGKIIDIVVPRGKEVVGPVGGKLAEISGRPDLKIGDAYPPCTMAEAIATGRLVRTPTPEDPWSVSVPTTTNPPKVGS